MRNSTYVNNCPGMGNLLVFVTIFCLATACTSASSHRDSTGSPAAEKPNVLFIAVDDLRPNLGCYGDIFAKTPNIDRLATRGLVFNRAYSQQAVCNPSRASLMTGLRPNTTKVWDLATHFRKALPDVVTLPQYFKQHGYHTQSIGKIYHDPAWAQDTPSWSVPETMAVTKTEGKYVLDANLNKKGSWKASATEEAPVADDAYVDGQVSQAAIDILAKIADRPFFLAVGFRRPHLPFSAPEKYWRMYDRAGIPLPANPEPPIGVPTYALHPSVELRGYTDVPDEGQLPVEKVRELIHGYYAGTSYVDAQIGKVLNALDELGLREKTIVVLWSDHGFHLGEHGLWCKTTNFELDTRVPLIIAYPRQSKKGVTTDALAELVDLYPTLADLAGLPVPDSLEGISQKPVLENPGSSVKNAAFSQFPRESSPDENGVMGYSVRTADYRYTEWIDLKSGKAEATELYDHREDPLETRNLSNHEQYGEVMQSLSDVLKQVH